MEFFFNLRVFYINLSFIYFSYLHLIFISCIHAPFYLNRDVKMSSNDKLSMSSVNCIIQQYHPYAARMYSGLFSADPGWDCLQGYHHRKELN